MSEEWFCFIWFLKYVFYHTEREEQERLEIEEREEEERQYMEKKAKLDEQMKKQAIREREIEEREAKRREELIARYMFESSVYQCFQLSTQSRKSALFSILKNSAQNSTQNLPEKNLFFKPFFFNG